MGIVGHGFYCPPWPCGACSGSIHYLSTYQVMLGALGLAGNEWEPAENESFSTRQFDLTSWVLSTAASTAAQGTVAPVLVWYTPLPYLGQRWVRLVWSEMSGKSTTINLFWPAMVIYLIRICSDFSFPSSSWVDQSQPPVWNQIPFLTSVNWRWILCQN